MRMVEILTFINSNLTLILGIIATLGAIIKPIRVRVIGWIKKITKADENAAAIAEIGAGVAKITASISLQSNAQQATMREFICRIYDKYYDTQEIPKDDRESLVVYYNNYKALGGNHDIDAKFEETKEWRTVKGKRGD